MKGITFERIVNQSENQSIRHINCELCSLIPIDPEVCSECREIFCKCCIDGYTLCPLCKKSYKGCPPMKNIIKMLQDVIITCKFNSNDCEEKLFYKDLISHENQCLFRECRCEGCGAILIYSKYDDHIKSCEALTFTCNDCGYTCKKSDSGTRHSCFKYFEFIFTEKMKIAMAHQLTQVKIENEEKINELRNYFDFLKSEINRIDDELRSMRLKIHTEKKIQEKNNLISRTTFYGDRDLTSGNQETYLTTDLGITVTNSERLQKEIKELNRSLNNINLEELNKSAVELGVADLKDYQEDFFEIKNNNDEIYFNNFSKSDPTNIKLEKLDNQQFEKNSKTENNSPDMRDINDFILTPENKVSNNKPNHKIFINENDDKFTTNKNTDRKNSMNTSGVYFHQEYPDNENDNLSITTPSAKQRGTLVISPTTQLSIKKTYSILDTFSKFSKPEEVPLPSDEPIKCIGVLDTLLLESNESFILTGHNFGSIVVWECSTMKVFRTYKEHSKAVWEVKQLPHFKGIFASASVDTYIKLFDVKSPTPIKVIKCDCPVYCIEPLPEFNKSFIASGGSNKNLILWDFKNKQKIMSREIERRYDLEKLLFLNKIKIDGKSNLILCVNFNIIRLINLNNLNKEREFVGHSNWINTLVYINDNKFASASSDGTLKLWSIAQDSCLYNLSIQNQLANLGGLITLPNSDKYLLLATNDKKVNFIECNEKNELIVTKNIHVDFEIDQIVYGSIKESGILATFNKLNANKVNILRLGEINV
jgi:WD40 repeat protein